MNIISITTLKVLRKLYSKAFHTTGPQYRLVVDSPYNAQQTSDFIYSMLTSDNPCMIARYGSTELACVRNYLGVTSKEKSWLKYIKGEQQEWWWMQNILNQMQQWSGFFPSNPDTVTRFSKLMIEDSVQTDLLGCWFSGDVEFAKDVADRNNLEYPKFTHLMFLEPFWCDNPWTRALSMKKVVVVHPFKEDIELQYKENRTLLFKNEKVLPLFDLRVVKAVQSLGGDNNGFKDWFEALEWMKEEIFKEDFDICLIGCGAYGFPLAAYCKRMGRKAIHLGGALQLLFGIKGKRWENPLYGVNGWGIPEGSYRKLMNENWVFPGQNCKPRIAEKIENGCYW